MFLRPVYYSKAICDNGQGKLVNGGDFVLGCELRLAYLLHSLDVRCVYPERIDFNERVDSSTQSLATHAVYRAK